MNRTMRRVLSVPAVALVTALTLLPGATTAQAAPTAQTVKTAKGTKASSWAAYFWTAGQTCTYDSLYPDGSTDVRSGRVMKRTKKSVKIGWGRGSSQTWKLAAGGRMVEPERIRDGATTMLINEVYPTVAQVRARRGSTNLTVTRRVTYSARDAKGFLTSGRTMLVTARYRVAGLGEKALTLPSGTVTAIGVRTTFRSVTVSNVRRAYVGRVKKFYLGEIRAASGDEWWAKGRGVVRWTWGTPGSEGVRTQRSCA